MTMSLQEQPCDLLSQLMQTCEIPEVITNAVDYLMGHDDIALEVNNSLVSHLRQMPTLWRTRIGSLGKQVGLVSRFNCFTDKNHF